MKRRITFTMERLGTASALCERVMNSGLSVDRTRSPSGGFIVCAVGEMEEGAAASLAHGLAVTIEADEAEG